MTHKLSRVYLGGGVDVERDEHGFVTFSTRKGVKILLAPEVLSAFFCFINAHNKETKQ